jgi:hypothetical protein
MAILNKIDKQGNLTKTSIIKLQLLFHCFLNKIFISEADIDCLTYLGECGEIYLIEFCENVTLQKIFKSTQTVRNSLAKAEKIGLLVKSGKSNKKISLNPNLKIQTSGNILVTYKFLHVDATDKSKVTNTRNSQEVK